MRSTLTTGSNFCDHLCYSVKQVAERLGISTKSLYTWMAQFSKPQRVRDQEAEVRRLKKKLARVTEERGI